MILSNSLPSIRRGSVAARTKVIDTKRTREQSSISFPYVDLAAATEIARAIYDRCGSEACNFDDLAKKFNDTAGGAFRLKVSAARIFDLIEKRGRSEVRLTESGMQIINDRGASEARIHAFLRVPLYEAVYSRFKSHTLPQRRGLEDEFKKLGVPAKQLDKARQVFERSARQAGFFDTSDNRLILPDTKIQQNGNKQSIKVVPMMNGDGAYGAAASDLGVLSRSRDDDPLIIGLVGRLPAAGSAWSDDARVAWLRLANSIFDVAYTDGSGKIVVRVGDDPLPIGPSVPE